MNGQPFSRWHINGIKRLPVTLLHPLCCLIHSAGNRLTQCRLPGTAGQRRRKAVDVILRGVLPLTQGLTGRPRGRQAKNGGQVCGSIGLTGATDTRNAILIRNPANAAGVIPVLRLLIAVGGAVHIRCRQRANPPVSEHKGDTVHLAPHTGERPVTTGGTGHHGPFHIRQFNTVGSQVVLTDKHLERIRVCHRAVDRHPPQQGRHCPAPDQSGILRQGVDGLCGGLLFLVTVSLHLLFIRRLLTGQRVIIQKGGGETGTTFAPCHIPWVRL